MTASAAGNLVSKYLTQRSQRKMKPQRAQRDYYSKHTVTADRYRGIESL
jgi:hypothetical protein